MQNAARIAAVFHLDPVAVLSEKSEFAQLMRAAATNVVVGDRRKAQEQAQKERTGRD